MGRVPSKSLDSPAIVGGFPMAEMLDWLGFGQHGHESVITILISHQKHYCHRNHQHIFSECHGGKRDRKHVPHAWTCNVETDGGEGQLVSSRQGATSRGDIR